MSETTQPSSSSSQSPLLYFPLTQFSPRFGDSFFTIEIIKSIKKKALSTFCYEQDVIYYEIEIRRGKNIWKVYKRYNEFKALYKSMEKSFFHSSDTPIPIKFPQKILFPTDVLLAERMKELEIILDIILRSVSCPSNKPIYENEVIMSFLEIKTNKTFVET